MKANLASTAGLGEPPGSCSCMPDMGTWWADCEGVQPFFETSLFSDGPLQTLIVVTLDFSSEAISWTVDLAHPVFD